MKKIQKFLQKIQSLFKPQSGLNFRRRRRRFKKEQMKHLAFQFLLIAFVLLLSFLTIKGFGIRENVYGTSMEPTLGANNQVLLNKVIYKISNPQSGDIIAFMPKGNKSSNISIKRIVAVPGDTLFISNGDLYINNEKYKEKITVDSMSDAGLAENEITLKDNEYFVLGDNRNNSEDSRYQTVGNIAKEDILGKVWFDVTFADFGFVN